jgi:hypothetical protein
MTVYTIQVDDTTGVDTHINSTTPTTNYGTNGLIATGEANSGVGDVYRILLKLVHSIPSNEMVTSAVLSLYVHDNSFSSNTRTMRAYRQLRAWTEAGATWNKYDGASNWGTAGGFNALDCEQTAIGSVSVATGLAHGTELQITLTPAAVDAWISLAMTNNGLLLKMDTETDDLYFFHSSGEATAGYRPKFVITTIQRSTNPVATAPFFMI